MCDLSNVEILETRNAYVMNASNDTDIRATLYTACLSAEEWKIVIWIAIS